MHPSLRTIFFAVLTVAFVALGSNGIVRADFFKSSVVEVPVDPNSAAAVSLTALVPTQKSSIEYSTQAELFRFTLSAKSEYTLRYATLAVGSKGLILPAKAQDWKVYAVQNGRVDFSKPVGYGEQWSDSLLRLRFSSASSVGTFGEAGEATFALVTSVLRDGAFSGAPSLSVNLPIALPAGMDWAFVPGHVNSTWMDVQNPFGFADVLGLPTAPLMKR